MVLDNRPKITTYWKFNVFLLGREDFWLQLTQLVQRKLVGTVVGNR